MISKIPVIETLRLRLRAHTRDDFAASAKLWSDPDVTRFIGGRPATREEAWTRLLRYAGYWALLGFGYWLVEEKSSGAFVGEVGFGDLQRDIDPPLGDAPEAGWVLSPTMHGRGYAIESVQAAHAWSDRTFPGRETVCIIAPENFPSLRVAEKCGYRESRRATYKDNSTIILTRKKEALS